MKDDGGSVSWFASHPVSHPPPHPAPPHGFLYGRLVYFDQWAPNRYAANAAFLALVGAEYGVSQPAKLREFAQSQIDYILTAGGDLNPDTKQPYYSYLIGYGDNFVRGGFFLVLCMRLATNL